MHLFEHRISTNGAQQMTKVTNMVREDDGNPDSQRQFGAEVISAPSAIHSAALPDK